MADQTLKVQDGATTYDVAHQFADGTRGLKVGMPGGTEGMNGSLTHTTVLVGVSATAMPSASLANRRHLIVQNAGLTNLYLGASGVTTSSYGVMLLPGQIFACDLGPSITLYGVSTAPLSGSLMEIA